VAGIADHVRPSFLREDRNTLAMSDIDPNLFYLDFSRVSEVLLTILVFALLLERALAIIFENKYFMDKFVYDVTRAKEDPQASLAQGVADPNAIVDVKPKFRGVKELIAFGVSFAVCWYWDFDALSVLMPVSHSRMTLFGELITAMVVAGGSKGAMKLFTDWLGIKSSAQKEIDEFRERQARARKP
jgi:hypothetical protein